MTTEASGRRFALASRATANALGALVLVLLGVTVTLAVLIHQLTILNVATGLTIPLVYAAVGVVVARHQSRNPVGWILIFFVVLLLIPLNASYYAVLRYRLGYYGLPLGPAAVAVASLLVLALALFPLVILPFPDARLARLGFVPVRVLEALPHVTAPRLRTSNRYFQALTNNAIVDEQIASR